MLIVRLIIFENNIDLINQRLALREENPRLERQLAAKTEEVEKLWKTAARNSLIEWFCRSLREECSWHNRFQSLVHAQHVGSQWIQVCKNEPPHQELVSAAPSAHSVLASQDVQQPGGHYRIMPQLNYSR